MTNTHHSDLWITWRNIIGDFMMEFSEIEFISYSLWSEHCSSGDPSHNFKARTKQVISQLNDSKYTEIKKDLERAIKLADKRNTIAHNPALLQIDINKEKEEIYRELAISTFNEGDYVDLLEIKELTAEARDIKTQLYMELGYLPQERKNA